MSTADEDFIFLDLAETSAFEGNKFTERFPAGMPLAVIREKKTKTLPQRIGIWVERATLQRFKVKQPQDGAARWKLGIVPHGDGKTNYDWATALMTALDQKLDVTATFSGHGLGTQVRVQLKGRGVEAAQPKKER